MDTDRLGFSPTKMRAADTFSNILAVVRQKRPVNQINLLLQDEILQHKNLKEN
jgi:hypothetical protein